MHALFPPFSPVKSGLVAGALLASLPGVGFCVAYDLLSTRFPNQLASEPQRDIGQVTS